MAGKNEIHAFLGAGTTFEGTLRFSGMVRIDSGFNGTIESEGMLVLGERAKVEGEVKVGELVSAGSIDGDVATSTKATLQKGSQFSGTLTTSVIHMEEGARFEGRIIMNQGKPQSPVTPVSPGEGAAVTGAAEKKSWFKR